MLLKDYFEIGYWCVSTFILCATVYCIYYSPIKAVKIGRELSDKQNRDNNKNDLFLVLYAHRALPTSHNFVYGLNQIDIVFQDVPDVLKAWAELHSLLHRADQIGGDERRRSLRVDLLSQMATSLGYLKLKTTDIDKSYVPQAHEDWDLQNQDYQKVAKDFFASGAKMHQLWIESLQGTPKRELD